MSNTMGEDEMVQGHASDESLDSHDSSSEGDDEEEADVDVNEDDAAAIMDLEVQLEADPWSYAAHVQLIDTLDRCKLRARLHDACTALHSRFPLNEALWLRWLASAVAAAGPAPAPRSVASVRGVFELAVGGILSVAVWLQYLDFERGLRTSRSASALDVERLRELFERAAATGGLHVARGAEIWLSWRRFEAAEDDGPALLRVLARQCGVCLGEPHAPRETLGELESWLAARAGAGAVEERTQAAARTAQKAWEDRAPFEAVLAAAAPESAERLRAWEDYVAWEAEQGHPARCQNLYERLVSELAFYPHLWEQYALWTARALKSDAGALLRVLSRATRACAWSGQLWALRLTAMDALECEPAAVLGAGEELLAANVQTAEELALCSGKLVAWCRRRQGAGGPEAQEGGAGAGVSSRASDSSRVAAVQALLERALALLETRFPDSSDALVELARVWATWEAAANGRAPAGRLLWERVVVGKAPARTYGAWAAWAAWELRFGQSKDARAVYRRAYAKRLEGGGEAWLRRDWLGFEQEAGSAQDAWDAQLKVEAANAKDAAGKAREAQRGGQGGRKRGAGSADDGGRVSKAARSGDGAILQRKNRAAGAQAPAKDAHPLSKEEIAAARRLNDPNYRPKAEEPHAAGKHTVFVKHLAAEVDEKLLRSLFEPVAGPVVIRMGGKGQQHRGFAYVDVASAEAMAAACEALDDRLVEGKHFFCAPSKPPGTKTREGEKGATLEAPAPAKVQEAPAQASEAARAKPEPAPSKSSVFPLVPRTVRNKVKVRLGASGASSKGSGEHAASPVAPAPEGEAAEGAAPGPKSNADFRAWLLGGKGA